MICAEQAFQKAMLVARAGFRIFELAAPWNARCAGRVLP